MSDQLVAGHDTERARAALETWFARRGLRGASVTVHPSPMATGHSYQTIPFDLTHDGTTQRFVARVEPGDRSVFPNPDIVREHRLLTAIADDAIPLPPVYGIETGTDLLGSRFCVMGFVDGVVASDSPPYTMTGWLYDASPPERERVWWGGLEAMARVHAVDWRARGLEFVAEGRPVGFGGEFEYWSDYARFAAPDGLPEVGDRAYAWLDSNRPEETETALCWGDSRLGNQLFRQGECVALLDWEMAALSDPMQDLAWFVYFDDVFTKGIGVPRLEGLPSPDETAERYADLTGRRVRNLDYFEVFAAFRFVAIMHRIGLLMVETGRLGTDSMFHRDNFATTHLAALCEERGIA